MKPIYLQLSYPADKTAAGASRFWGNPDLPSADDYPMYTDDEGDEYPYFFICQIRLEDIATLDTCNLLPHKGLLLFFAKIDRYLGYEAETDCIGGAISDEDAVRVLYYPSTEGFKEIVLLDVNDEESSPREMRIDFSSTSEPLADEHMLFAPPTHREWETWDDPHQNRVILLQIDSFEGSDFTLNFMDFGVLDLLIAPERLVDHDFNDVRGIVLST